MDGVRPSTEKEPEMPNHTSSPDRSATLRRGPRILLLVACVAAAFALVGAASASAGDPLPPNSPAPAGDPAQVDLPDEVEQPVDIQTDWDGLFARADRDGSVRVVVALEPGRSDHSKAEHLANLTKTRDKLLGEFKDKPMKDANAIEGSPIVAFEADRKDLSKLQHSKFVRNVTVDESHEMSGTVSNGAANGVQLTKWWDYTRIGADWANNNGYTGRGQAVVVIDSGVDRSNGWLSGKVTTEACFATNTNGTGACPNGSTYSYNTTSAGVTGAATPCTYASGCAHGTHVAHTAAGAYGVARGAAIVGIQASHAEWNSKTGAWEPRFSNSDLINALWYVYYKLPFRPAAVNMSIGGTGYTTSCDSAVPDVTSYINALKNVGVATIISSGNNDYIDGISWPSCITNAISVGNTTLDTAGNDAVLGYTTYGSNSSANLDLLAPGTDICSAVPVGLDVDGVKDGVACDWYGTSMAAPHVAGAFAQIRQSRPTATVDQILSALQRRGTAVYDSRNGITRTRINVANTIYYF